MIMVIIVVWGLGPIGFGWVSYLVGCVGFGSMKWTHGQHCARVTEGEWEPVASSHSQLVTPLKSPKIVKS